MNPAAEAPKATITRGAMAIKDPQKARRGRKKEARGKLKQQWQEKERDMN